MHVSRVAALGTSFALAFAIAGCQTPASSDWVATARSRMSSGDYTSAADALTRALDAAPRDLEALELRANCRARLYDYEGALADFDRGLELAPNEAWLNYGRGAVLHSMGRYDGAIESLTRAIEIEPRAFKAWQHRAACRAEIGEHALAVEDYARAIELTPRDDRELPSLYRWRSQSLDQLGRRAEAERDWQAAERLVEARASSD